MFESMYYVIIDTTLLLQWRVNKLYVSEAKGILKLTFQFQSFINVANVR